MFKYLVHIYDWDRPHEFRNEQELKKGEKVVVKSGFGNELGTVIFPVDSQRDEQKESGLILRKATEKDIEIYKGNQKEKKSILEECRREVKRLGLPIKLADAEVTLDRSGVIVVFSAEERIDFRALVKNLSRILRRSVRMHQIGSRDEARRAGGCGICGRTLCCALFLKEMPSISVETARIQQIAHRGSERISGQCGRLLCCLSYEAQQYRELLEGMPAVGSNVKAKSVEGEVAEINALTQEVKIKTKDGNVVIIKKSELK